MIDWLSLIAKLSEQSGAFSVANRCSRKIFKIICGYEDSFQDSKLNNDVYVECTSAKNPISSGVINDVRATVTYTIQFSPSPEKLKILFAPSSSARKKKMPFVVKLFCATAALNDVGLFQFACTMFVPIVASLPTPIETIFPLPLSRQIIPALKKFTASVG